MKSFVSLLAWHTLILVDGGEVWRMTRKEKNGIVSTLDHMGHKIRNQYKKRF
jgi:hypothetical protein